MKPHDPLDDLLVAWQVEDRAPADFQRHVWHRIATDHQALPWSMRLFSWWFQPRRLVVSSLAAVVMGAFFGLIEAGLHRTDARAAYMSAINPLDSHHHHPLAAK